MRIGYVPGEFPKHSETFVLNEMIELLRLGHEIYIFPLFHLPQELVHPEVEQYHLRQRTYFRPAYGRLAQELPGMLAALGTRHKNWKNKLLCLATAGYFAKQARPLHLDILHTHFANEPTYLAMLMAKKIGIPYTFTAHAFDIYIQPDVKALQERMQSAAAVVTSSFYNRDYLHTLTGWPKEKIRVVRACTNPARFSLPAAAAEPFTLISVGRLVEKKGLAYAVQAVGQLRRRFPTIQYHIVGQGPLVPELRALVHSLGLEKHVLFLGALDGEAVKQAISQATLAVLPCVRAKNNDVDVCPLVLQEAMWLKKPVVSTRLASVPELITNGEEGFLVEPANVGLLAEAVEKLLQQPELARRMGEKGAQKVARDFNLSSEVKKLIQIWEEILLARQR